MSQEEKDRQVKFAMSSLKVGDDKRKQKKKPPTWGEEQEASLRVSSWGGLYDEMVDDLEDHAATPSSPPMPKEESHKKSASSKHRLASYQIRDVIDEERAEEDNSEKHRKSKHRSHHKKSHRHDHSDGKPDEENEKHHRRRDLDSSTTSEKSKPRRHRHTENHSLATIEKSKSRRSKHSEEGDSKLEKKSFRHSLATIEKSKSRRSKHSEEGDSMKLGEKSKSRRHRRVKVPLGEEDDELSKRIAEKLREKELEKKKSRRATRSAPGGSNVSSSVCSDNEEVDEEVDADRRESIAKWTESYTSRQAMRLANRTPEIDWLSSFYRRDPRWQIMKFFNEVSREGGVDKIDEEVASPLAQLFDKARVFTVWRPTSDEAIKNMMLGKATGKGLDIKGKSAKKGNISSYVPFIQVYKDQDKEKVRAYLRDGRTIRVFYQTEELRNEAHEMVTDVKDYMLFAAMDAMRVLSDEFASPEEQELAMKHLMYDDTTLAVKEINTYIDSNPPAYGLIITERLFWEAYVMIQDCSRPSGTEWDIGRGSEVNFMEMNLKTMRYVTKPGDARPVVFQMNRNSPMEPRTLLVAYEEHSRVMPVVSDFDCFLTGTRGVKYKQPIPADQVDLVKWSVDNISDVLDDQVATKATKGWMETWFGVLRKAAMKGFYPKTPKYGNGDPRSYEIIEVAVSRLSETGCVRHGAECFNYFFPQDIDDTLLIISDTLPGKLKWMKVNEQQLQEVLLQKIDEGFTFPLNPKWVLCDPGWKRVYDKLLASNMPNVQDSLKCWLPPDSGLREKIEDVSRKHPNGFGQSNVTKQSSEGTELMDTMEYRLRRLMKVQRAWRKLRLVLFWMRFIKEKRLEYAEQNGRQLKASETLGRPKRP